MIKSDLETYDAETRKVILKTVSMLISPGKEMVPENHWCAEDIKECNNILDGYLFAFVNDRDKTVPSKKSLPRNLHTILQYIESNYTNPDFSIKYMASVFGTSPSNLSHQFKKLTNQTLSRFIDELRISKAEEMLDAGEKIQDVAQKLGYSTTPVFTETYKRVRGITPSAYRSQNRENTRSDE